MGVLPRKVIDVLDPVGVPPRVVCEPGDRRKLMDGLDKLCALLKHISNLQVRVTDMATIEHCRHPCTGIVDM